MKRWEFQFVLLHLSDATGATHAMQRLNEFGADGWELVSVLNVAPILLISPNEYADGQEIAFLKRELV